MSTSDNNNITKHDALDFMCRSCKNDKSYVIDAIVSCTLHGAEYPSSHRYGHHEMSYFCRAFNITEYNVSKQKNKIKNRYKKYAVHPGVEDFLRQTLHNAWPGFPDEFPRMDNILMDFVSGRSTVPQGRTQNRNPQVNHRPNATPQFSDSPDSPRGQEFDIRRILEDKRVWVAGGILLCAVLFTKSCGHAPAAEGTFQPAGEYFQPLLNKIRTIIISILTFVALAVPAYVFFKQRTWKNTGRLFGGVLSFYFAYSVANSAYNIQQFVFAFILWVVGILLWNRTK